MQTCPNCQTSNANTAPYCTACGSPLGAPPSAQPPNFPQPTYPQPQYPLPQYTPPPQPPAYPPNYPPPPAVYYVPYPVTPPLPPQSKSILPAVGAIILLLACFLPFFDLQGMISNSSGSLITPEMLGIQSSTGTASVFQIIIGIVDNSQLLFAGMGHVSFFFYLPFIYLLTLLALPINAIIGLTAFFGTEKTTQRARNAGKNAFWTTIAFWIGLLVILLALGSLGEGYAPDFGTLVALVFHMIGIGVPMALVGAGLQWFFK